MIAPTRKPFLTRRTIKLLTDKARNTVYRFSTPPERAFNEDYGVYLHVPFCHSLCSFCPYYREGYSQERKLIFMESLLKEIDLRDFSGHAKWLYIGGGTPNSLSIGDWELIFKALRKKVEIPRIGMELTPRGVEAEYLEGLKRLGVGKISLGVESFSQRVLSDAGRESLSPDSLRLATRMILDAGLWLNIDIMLGFQGQKAWNFRQDITEILKLEPHQLTIYPLMTVRGTRVNALSMDDRVIFELMEEAGTKLERARYRRKTLWTWGRDEGLYDSSYDELGSDYIGLGPSGISSCRQWVSVNLPLDGYARAANEATEARMRAGTAAMPSFVNRHVKTQAHEAWRRFGMMLYGRRLSFSSAFPPYLNLFISSLILSGRAGLGGGLSRKGILFAHDLTKAIVETKSFPIQQPDCVENWAEYLDYAKGKTL